MSKHWRPENWARIRAHRLAIKEADTEDTLIGGDKYCFQSYETGADAMLEVVKALGSYCDYYVPSIIKGLDENAKGWLVFIPDEGEK